MRSTMHFWLLIAWVVFRSAILYDLLLLGLDLVESWALCAPIIDPWYGVRSHFPKVPDNYMPLPPSRVWLALCRGNTEAPWAPLASSIPNLIIC